MKTLTYALLAVGITSLTACTTVVEKHRGPVTQETRSVQTPVGGVSTTTTTY